MPRSSRLVFATANPDDYRRYLMFFWEINETYRDAYDIDGVIREIIRGVGVTRIVEDLDTFDLPVFERVMGALAGYPESPGRIEPTDDGEIVLAILGSALHFPLEFPLGERLACVFRVTNRRLAHDRDSWMSKLRKKRQGRRVSITNRKEWIRLLHDIRPLVDDLKARTRGEWRTWYAIDSAEIHSFLEPAMGKAFRTADEDDRVAFANEQQTMRWLLFGNLAAFTDMRLLLLPPHQLEFGKLIGAVQASTLEDAQRIEREREMISAEAEEIASSPRFLALADLVASGSDLSPEVISEIVTYLETKASTLNWFLRATSEPPVTRLTELLELGHTVDFEYATDLPITVDQRTYDYWLQKLPEKRRRESRRGAILDASAIALLNATNKRLKATNQRVCLITRAQSMFEVHAEEAEKERWQELWPILRHPRAFAAIRHLPATSTEELARQAEKIAKSIQLVLDDGSGENNDESRQEMESEIEQLSETWRSLSRLAVSSQWNPLISHEVSEDMVRFQRFFDATQNSEAIRDRVEARRRKLLDETEKSLWLHAFLIKEQSVRKGLRENSVRATRSDGRTTISCRYASVPFQIEFFSPTSRPSSCCFRKTSRCRRGTSSPRSSRPSCSKTPPTKSISCSPT